ncbi:MAG TPA: zf-HC2 domain-containing protein, partial [Terriglobales bacterium]
MKHELPKRVQTAMGGAPLAGTHPSADELNAYAEQSLTAREREQVASHLATCADCRDVLMVSDVARTPEPLQAGRVSASAPRWHA